MFCSILELMNEMDFTQLITREVLTDSKEKIGHIDGLDDKHIIVKDGLIDPKYYRIPSDKVISFQEGKVLLSISKQDAERRFKRKYLGYFKDVKD